MFVKIIRSISLLLLTAVIISAFAACSDKNDIVGTWKNSSEILEQTIDTVYVFGSDGTGKMETVFGIVMEFTYTLSDGKLELTHSLLGKDTVESFDVSFEDGKLNMTSADGITFTYTRQ